MMEQRIIVVVLVTMCCLWEIRAAQVAVAHTASSGCNGANGACGSGVAHSSSTGPDGITTGECAYTDPEGRAIKIKYREFQSGKVEAQADNVLVVDPVVELRRCRGAVEVGQREANQHFTRIEAEHQQFQQQLQRQQEQLQQQISQQQAFFNGGNFPFNVGFNPVPFPNFQPGFGQF